MLQEHHEATNENQELLAAKDRLSSLVNDSLDKESKGDSKYAAQIVLGPDNTRVSISRTLGHEHTLYAFHMQPEDKSWLREVYWEGRSNGPVTVGGIHEGEAYDYELGAEKIDELAEELLGLESVAINVATSSATVGRGATKLALKAIRPKAS